MKASQVASASTAELLSFFNLNTGGAQVKKFADRKTAERRVLALIAEMLEDGDLTPEKPIIGEFTHCPHCGVHLSNGATTYDELKHDHGNINLSDMTHEYMCLGCCGFFGPEVKKPARNAGNGAPASKRVAMSDSLKLCRIITCLETGESWPNAFRMWKENPSWMTSAQVDRLTGVLYAAAKQPTPVAAVVTINGRSFKLAQI